MEFIVKANENCTANGVGKSIGTFNRGDVVTITCKPEDTWLVGPDINFLCNANGLADPAHKNPYTNISNGAMVGSIDAGRNPFVVGLECKVSITLDNTTIHLYCLDINSDNSGEITAFVKKN